MTKQTDIRGSVLSGLRWTAGAKLATQFLSWASTIVVMRLLQPEDYGLVAMAGVFMALCMLLNEVGLGAAIVHTKNITAQTLRQVFTLVIIVNSVLFVGLLLGADMIGQYYDAPMVAVIVPVLALQFVIVPFSVIPQSLLMRDMRFRAISVVEGFTALVGNALTLTLAFLGFGVWALIFGNLAMFLTRAVGLNWVNPFLRWPTVDFSEFREVARFGGYTAVGRLLWYVYTQSDVLIGGRILGKTLLGYYSVGLQLSSLPLQKIGSVISQVSFPAYSRIQDEPAKVARYVRLAARVWAFFAFPVFFGISSVAPELVQSFLGDKWTAAIVPLQLLSLMMALRSIGLTVQPALRGTGHPEIATSNALVACIIMPTAFYFGAQWGLLGLSAAWVVGFTPYFFFMLWRSLPVLGVTVGEFLGELKATALSATVMYAVVAGTRVIISTLSLSPILSLMVLSAVGAAVYAALMLGLWRDTCNTVWSLVRG